MATTALALFSQKLASRRVTIALPVKARLTPPGSREQLGGPGPSLTQESQPPFVSTSDRPVGQDKWLHLLEP